MCAFDFDGTLAPIVDHPEQAALPGQTRLLLARLAALYPCVILSGRGRADLVQKLRGVPVARLIGNHGAETEQVDPGVRSQVQRWKAAIQLGIAPLPGLWLEDKGLSLAVHYRESPNKKEARELIQKITSSLHQVRLIGGKQVVNLVIDGAPNKGHALVSERERLHCTSVLYVGDDDNDEDAFAAEGDVVAVRVGKKKTTHARYYLRSQAEIDRLIELMVLLRSPEEADAACAEQRRRRDAASHALASQ
jgi:trehalose 6-phosphate phosphatase